MPEILIYEQLLHLLEIQGVLKLWNEVSLSLLPAPNAKTPSHSVSACNILYFGYVPLRDTCRRSEKLWA